MCGGQVGNHNVIKNSVVEKGRNIHVIRSLVTGSDISLTGSDMIVIPSDIIVIGSEVIEDSIV